MPLFADVSFLAEFIDGKCIKLIKINMTKNPITLVIKIPTCP